MKAREIPLTPRRYAAVPHERVPQGAALADSRFVTVAGLSSQAGLRSGPKDTNSSDQYQNAPQGLHWNW